jgi:hypothetical protein
MSGVEGWGRHLRNGSATAARQHVALTHPSNLHEIVGGPHHHRHGVATWALLDWADPGCSAPDGAGRGVYTVPSRSSAKRIPARRRARATTAIFFPRRAAMRCAQSRSSAVRGSRSRSIDTAA